MTEEVFTSLLRNAKITPRVPVDHAFGDPSYSYILKTFPHAWCRCVVSGLLFIYFLVVVGSGGGGACFNGF